MVEFSSQQIWTILATKSNVIFRGVNQMLTIANEGGEGVKKHEKHANVICERSLILFDPFLSL